MSELKAGVFDSLGVRVGEEILSEELFGRPANIPLIHQVVVAQLAAARQGTHKTKTRGEVSGSGRKPFRQKGTGNARQGSRRAPQMRGGGVVHGPRPRDYAQRTPKKMIAAALLGCLSDRARAGRIHLFPGFGETPSIRNALAFFEAAGLGSKTLVLLKGDDWVVYKSVRNIPGVHVLGIDQVNSYDVLCSDDLLLTREAYQSFLQRKLQAKAGK